MATIAAGWTRGVLDYATSQGMKRDRLLSVAGLREEQLASPDSRVERACNARLWQQVETQLGDPELGLRLTQRMRPGALGIVGFAAQSCPTLGEAMELFVELYPLLREWGRAELVVKGSEVMLRSIPSESPGRWSRSLAEVAVATQVAISRQWLGEPYSPLAAHFRHPKPRDTRLHEQIFGCPVSFDQPHDELVFHREALALPLRSTEPALREYLRAIARARLGELSPVNSMVRDVKDALDAALTRGDLGISLEQVARELSTSARSLQRHLRHQGSTFQQMLDQARQRRAMALLRQPGVTLSQVSDELGFSEPSALRRALRRWGQEHRASSRMEALPAQ